MQQVAATVKRNVQGGEMAGQIAESARTAYALGWSLSGGPMTGRVRAGCTAAVSLAIEYADEPDVLETTLKLGSLTGTWATVYARRDDLLAKHVAAILDAWRTCVASLNARKLISRYRAAVYLPREAADPHKDFWKTEATAVALGWLRGIYNSRGYDTLIAAIEDAVRAGMAEGEAGALALAADRAGTTGFVIADAFKAAYERMAKDSQVPQQAADALATMIDSAGSDLARALASQTEDGGTYDDMLTQSMDTAGGTGVRAVKTWADWAVSSAILAGARKLYALVRSAIGGETLVNWVDAGDGRVCATCEGYADGSPYAPADIPSYPHPRCRCSTEPAGPVPTSFFSALLGGGS
jgi:hypothetical protein